VRLLIVSLTGINKGDLDFIRAAMATVTFCKLILRRAHGNLTLSNKGLASFKIREQ
jgi:hypothetical protein